MASGYMSISANLSIIMGLDQGAPHVEIASLKVPADLHAARRSGIHPVFKILRRCLRTYRLFFEDFRGHDSKHSDCGL